MGTSLKIAYDPVLRQPGCVLLQATFGANIPDFGRLFPVECWGVGATPDMALYGVTPEQLDYLTQLAKENPSGTDTTAGEGDGLLQRD